MKSFPELGISDSLLFSVELINFSILFSFSVFIEFCMKKKTQLKKLKLKYYKKKNFKLWVVLFIY